MSESDVLVCAARARAGDGEPPPWQAPVLRGALASVTGHATLIQSQGDAGQFELACAIASAWLCEDDATPAARRPCGRCAGCKLLAVRSHPDLLVVVPEVMREPLDWRLGGRDFDTDGDGKTIKAKPSREIRLCDLRAVLEFAATTSARGRCKVVIFHPAERMNEVAATALLKTLEEPPGDVRFLLCTSAAAALLPTVRSRCQVLAQPLPSAAVLAAWLEGRGVADAKVLAEASGLQPYEALALHALGLGAGRWLALPRHVKDGDPTPLRGVPLSMVVDVLQKIAHDAAAVACGAAPRYFPAASLPVAAGLPRLLRWMAELRRVAEEADHPWLLDLSLEALVAQGREALQTPRTALPGAARHR